MVEDASLWETSTKNTGGSTRWSAPELLLGEEEHVTRQSDVYAYAMTCFVGFNLQSGISVLTLCTGNYVRPSAICVFAS